jgi:hypothetical protein
MDAAGKTLAALNGSETIPAFFVQNLRKHG